jgi:hypothetical protein
MRNGVDISTLNSIIQYIPKESVWKLYCEVAELSIANGDFNNIDFLIRKALLSAP